MADKYFDDWESLIRAVEKTIPKILKNDVAPVAEDILKKHIKSDIYDAYSPTPNGWVGGQTYQRRHVLEDKVASILSDNRTLLVTSTATASPSVIKGWSFHNRYAGSFLKLLEVGNMGIWKRGFPRPAVSNTETEFEGSAKIKTAIKNGISREIGVCFEI